MAGEATGAADDLAGDTVDEIGGQLPLGLDRVVSLLRGGPTVPKLVMAVLAVVVALFAARRALRS